MKQYQKVIKQILESGVEKESGRENMPNVIGISNATIKMDLKDGFPLLTTKKMYWKGVVHELLWFLRGETNIKYLVDNNVNIWNQDAYRWYLHHTELNNNSNTNINSILYKNEDGSFRVYSEEEFVEAIKDNNLGLYEYEYEKFYELGDLGKVYGYQWRNQNGVDQVKNCLDGLKNNPYSRYHIINGWNGADFPEMALPPCHLLYQFIVRPLSFKERRDLASQYAINNAKFPLLINAYGEKGLSMYMDVIDNTGWNIPKFYLDLNMYQRSCDTFLGLPFNLASTALLLKLFAKVSNMEEGVATWIGGDTHLYKEHVSVAEEQLKREPFKLPELKITKEIKNLEDILSLTIDDFVLENYESHPILKAELFTGLK